MKDPRIFHIGNDRRKFLYILSILSKLMIAEQDDLELEIRQRKKEKTHEQRKLWHAELTEFGRELGYTMLQIKEVVKREFFGSTLITMPNGKMHEVIPSSEEADRYNYSELIEFTRRLAAENGVILGAGA